MFKKYKNVLIIFFGVIFCFLMLFAFGAKAVNNLFFEENFDADSQIISQNTQMQNQNDGMVIDVDKNVEEIVNNQKPSKPVEETTLSDIIRNEKVSPEIKERIGQLINQSQYQLDNYRSIVDNYQKQIDNKLVEYKKELDNVNSFKDEMEANLNIAKWMIISLSIGIMCLTTIVIVMWRGVVNVDRNDVEVLFSIEKAKKDVRQISKRMEILETAYKRDGKQ